jgi:hypothetical protein
MREVRRAVKAVTSFQQRVEDSGSNQPILDKSWLCLMERERAVAQSLELLEVVAALVFSLPN